MAEATREQGVAIKEALSKLTTIQVEQDVYILFSDVLDTTGDILYPDGLKTQEEYNRLVVISKAGCVAVGYSDEQIELVPPNVSFQQRGAYLIKMPAIADKVIAEAMEEMTGQNDEWTEKPCIIIRREKLARRISIFHLKESWNNLSNLLQKHLDKRCDEVAAKLGWNTHSNDEVWEQEDVAYVRPITPNIEACRKALSDWTLDHSVELDDLIRLARRAAFGKYVEDPEELISHETWRDLFDELGYIYDSEKSKLTPKPLLVPGNAQVLLTEKINALRTSSGPRYQDFLIKDDLYQAVKEVLGEGITNRQIEKLIHECVVGRALVKLGYQHTTSWADRRDLDIKTIKKYRYGTEVFRRAIQVDPNMQTPAFADGFRIHSPVLVRDERTLVYMELLGPRQAVKANWAALRQRNRNHYLKGVLSVNKEDRMTTLKSALPCGWDHWCLIHRQASYEKLTPNSTFYLINHTPETTGPPSTFIAFLAKSLAIPILPSWAEHLWIEGRIKELITPLSEDCYGLGGFRVETDQWSEIISHGLSKKHISF